MNAKHRQMALSRRALLFGCLLVITGFVYGASLLHMQMLERELDEMARSQVSRFRSELEGDEAADVVRIGSRVVASRAFLLFGKVTGKISVFVEHPGTGHSEGYVEAFDFFYERSEGAWHLTESGRCTSESCTLEGKRVLETVVPDN